MSILFPNLIFSNTAAPLVDAPLSSLQSLADRSEKQSMLLQ